MVLVETQCTHCMEKTVFEQAFCRMDEDSIAACEQQNCQRENLFEAGDEFYQVTVKNLVDLSDLKNKNHIGFYSNYLHSLKVGQLFQLVLD